MGESRRDVGAGLMQEMGERQTDRQAEVKKQRQTQRDREYNYISLSVQSWRFLPLIPLFGRERQYAFLNSREARTQY